MDLQLICGLQVFHLFKNLLIFYIGSVIAEMILGQPIFPGDSSIH